MKTFLKRYFNRIKNRLYFKFKKKISDNSKDIYAIVLMGISHASHGNNRIICDPIHGDIIIKLKDLGYHIIITYNDVIITNHDFPNLGAIEKEVVDKLMIKGKCEISRLRQIEKNEILENHKILLKKVKEKVRINERIARLKIQTDGDNK